MKLVWETLDQSSSSAMALCGELRSALLTANRIGIYRSYLSSSIVMKRNMMD